MLYRDLQCSNANSAVFLDPTVQVDVLYRSGQVLLVVLRVTIFRIDSNKAPKAQKNSSTVVWIYVCVCVCVCVAACDTRITHSLPQGRRRSLALDVNSGQCVHGHLGRVSSN